MFCCDIMHCDTVDPMFDFCFLCHSGWVRAVWMFWCEGIGDVFQRQTDGQMLSSGI